MRFYQCIAKRLKRPVVISPSFAGWSALNNTLVIDVSHINSVSISEEKMTATVGDGNRLGSLYTALWEYGLTFHAGICPTVDLEGYAGVGGMMPTCGLQA